MKANDILPFLLLLTMCGLFLHYVYTSDHNKQKNTPPTELTNPNRIDEATSFLNEKKKTEILRFDCTPIQEKTYQCVLTTLNNI